MTVTERAIRFSHHLAQSIDGSSLDLFRRFFGMLICFAAIRFMAHGWIDELLIEPSFLFSWVPGIYVAPRPWMYGLFILQAIAGIAIALGYRPRLWLSIWLPCFVYVELLDKTLYLNHYVLFTLLGVLLLFLPPRRHGESPGTPRWLLWSFRLLVGTVYFWAGISKLNPDWLLAGEPLTTWLKARVDLPFIGPLLGHKYTALLMSWGGIAYDLTIPFLLLSKPTRRLGLLLVLIFHTVVGLLFPIGIFPIVMIACASLFCEPHWPRRWLSLPDFNDAQAQSKAFSFHPAAWVTLTVCLSLFPARHLLYTENVNWSEEGFRFSWRVMLIEKTGLVDYRIIDKKTGRTWHEQPGCHLTVLQHKQMRTQPDMIRDFALYLQRLHRRQGRDVAVYADSWASLHQRPAQRMLRADVDLTKSLSDLRKANWIIPMKEANERLSVFDR